MTALVSVCAIVAAGGKPMVKAPQFVVTGGWHSALPGVLATRRLGRSRQVPRAEGLLSAGAVLLFFAIVWLVSAYADREDVSSGVSKRKCIARG